ncbi:MAG TPA: DUF1559 domain-containing protein [Lacipirellula sp.]
MATRTWTLAVLAAAILGATPTRMRAAENDALAPYLTDDVVAVGRVDLEQVDLTAIVEELIRVNALSEAEVDQHRRDAARAQDVVRDLVKRGAQRVYALLRVRDIAAGGTTWVMETESAESAASLAKWLNERLAELAPLGDAAQVLPKAVKAQGAVVVGAASDERVEEIFDERTDSPRPEAVAALESLADADAGLIIFGDDDGRRVVRELFPQMPAPFMEIDGELLADGIAWGSVQVKLPPDATISLVIETSSDETAAVLELAFGKAREILRGMLLADKVGGPPAHKERAAVLLPMLPQLKLERDGERLSMTFGDDESELKFLRYALPAMTQDIREDAYRASRMNNFKQIALGLLNYESANKKFPTQAVYSEDGKPLLSWRVMILPYLEEMALYKQFKLDEPWDSEHNRKLIEKMPAVYADPDPSVQTAAGAGKTTFLSTVGEGLFFEDREPRTWRSITDGTSNTALLLEAAPERAVPWTKPEDLEDLAGVLERKDRDWFTAGFVDGHVRILSTKNDASVLKALLTPAGKEVVEPSEIK